MITTDHRSHPLAPWKHLHLLIGIAGVVAFLLTGHRWLSHLDGMADSTARWAAC